MTAIHRTNHIKLLAVTAFLFLTLLAADFPGTLYAQAKNGKIQNGKNGNSAADDAKKEKIVKDLTAKGMDSNDFVYQPKGRRDPFWNLLKGKNVRLKREAKDGISGLLIDELELEGIITTDGQYIALFKGPDGRPYAVKIGDNVYDGEVLDITGNTVVFKRTLTTTSLGGTKEKLITKRLVPDEEAAKK